VLTVFGVVSVDKLTASLLSIDELLDCYIMEFLLNIPLSAPGAVD